MHVHNCLCMYVCVYLFTHVSMYVCNILWTRTFVTSLDLPLGVQGIIIGYDIGAAKVTLGSHTHSGAFKRGRSCSRSEPPMVEYRVPGRLMGARYIPSWVLSIRCTIEVRTGTLRCLRCRGTINAPTE